MTLTREQILAALDCRTGSRGRPRQSAAEQKARQGEVFKLIWGVLGRPARWGELSQLQRKVQRKYGIASSEFYAIVKKAKFWRRVYQRLNDEQSLIDRHITPDEWTRWQHRSGAALARLARMRAHRK